MKRIWSLILLICICSSCTHLGEYGVKRSNNISAYQNTTTEEYLVGVYTNLESGRFFLNNSSEYVADVSGRKTSYYNLTTIGKYITKSVTIKGMVEKCPSTQESYYIGMGYDF